MSKTYFTGDWHLGHKSILKYRTQFKTIEEHEELLFSNYEKIITKRDTVYFLGDILFDKKYINRIKALKGHKILVVGNHDTDHLNMADLIECFDKIYSLYRRGTFWMSHAPIHPDELRGRFNIHGHTHDYIIDDARYINVCVEQTDFAPIGLEVIKEKVKHLPLPASRRIETYED